MNKSIVILTNFWDADYIITGRTLLSAQEGSDKVYKININQADDTKHINQNYSVNSIALKAPDPLPKSLGNISRLDFLCPTYEMLKRYKSDKNWDKYTIDYKNLLRNRKDEIRDWIGSLKPDFIYILCCWENTSKGAHCHREILHKAFCNSKTAKDKIISIYRSGGNKTVKDTSGYDGWRSTHGFAQPNSESMRRIFNGLSSIPF